MTQEWNGCICNMTWCISNHLPFLPLSTSLLHLVAIWCLYILLSHHIFIFFYPFTFPGLSFQPHSRLIATNVFCIELQPCCLVAVRLKAADVELCVCVCVCVCVCIIDIVFMSTPYGRLYPLAKVLLWYLSPPPQTHTIMPLFKVSATQCHG